MRFEKHIRVEAGARLLDLLSSHTDLSKTTLKDCLNKGCVWLKRVGRKERRIRRAKFELCPGDTVAIFYDHKILSQDIPEPACLADHKEYSIWNKPAGMLSQGTRYGDHCSLLRFAEKRMSHRSLPHLVHRLDREAHGIVLLAHGKRAASLFSKLFRDRRIIKRYRAHVHGVFNLKSGRQEISDPLDGKPAATSFRVVEEDHEADTSLLDIEIHTGRYHQIRRHFSGIGHPLVGDSRYARTGKSDMMQLQAYELEFTCPFSNRKVTCRVPALMA